MARCQQLKITSQRWPFSLTANIFWWSQKLYFKRYFWFRERANSVAPVTLDKPLMRPFSPNFKLIKLQQHKTALDTDFLYKSTLFCNALLIVPHYLHFLYPLCHDRFNFLKCLPNFLYVRHFLRAKNFHFSEINVWAFLSHYYVSDRALIFHFRPRGVSFTGSDPVSKQWMSFSS